jgi:tetratricopeptide (TPR) repeat protein
MNNSNVYAYLALGDAYEKIENYKKAICVYRELASLG